MKKHNDQKIGEALKEWIDSSRIKSKLNQTRIKALWHEVMGPSIGRYTKELSVRGKKLYVNLDSAPLKQELSMGREKIKNMINEALGEEFLNDVIIL